MSKFDFIKDKIEYAETMNACEIAEQVTTPAGIALKCREALECIIHFVYSKEKAKLPATAAMLELIDSRVISLFVDNDELRESLHYIRNSKSL